MDLKQEIDAQLELVGRVRQMLQRAADDVDRRLTSLENPLAKVEAMTRLADIMTRVARTAADLQRTINTPEGSAAVSLEDLLREDLKD